MVSHKVVSDGIIYSSTRSGKHYISVYAHRGSGDKTKKSVWCIKPVEEFGVFCNADDGNWADNNGHYWGISNNGLDVIGEDGEILCKFPRNDNENVPWHGFPVSPAKDINDSPPDVFIQNWINAGVINKTIGRRIQRGKI